MAVALVLALGLVPLLFLVLRAFAGRPEVSWIPPADVEMYSAPSLVFEGATSYVVLLPDGDVMFAEVGADRLDAALEHWSGIVGEHLMWRFWRTDARLSLFGVWVYPSKSTPVRIRYKLLNSTAADSRRGRPFIKLGTEREDLLLQSGESISWQHYTLHRIPLDSSVLDRVAATVGKAISNPQKLGA